MRAPSSAARNGLTTKSSAPLANASTMSVVELWPLKKRTGRVAIVDVVADATAEIEAAHSGERPVEDDEIERRALDPLERLLGGRRARDDEPDRLEHRGHDLARLGIVVDDEDAPPSSSADGCRRGAAAGGACRPPSARLRGTRPGADRSGATASRAGWRWPPTRAASRWAARRPLASPARRWGAPSRTRARECAPSRASRTPRTAARRAQSRARRRRSPGAPRQSRRSRGPARRRSPRPGRGARAPGPIARWRYRARRGHRSGKRRSSRA